MIDPVLISQAAIGVLARRMAVAHAPKGGVTINGRPYVGGEFIPGMTQDEVDKVADGDGSYDVKHKLRGMSGKGKKRFVAISKNGQGNWVVDGATDDIVAYKAANPFAYAKYYDTHEGKWVRPGKKGPVKEPRDREAYKEVPGHVDSIADPFVYRKTLDEYKKTFEASDDLFTEFDEAEYNRHVKNAKLLGLLDDKATDYSIQWGFGGSYSHTEPSESMKTQILSYVSEARDALISAGISPSLIHDITAVSDDTVSYAALARGEGRLTVNLTEKNMTELGKVFSETKKSYESGETPLYAFASVADMLIHEAGHNLHRTLTPDKYAEFEMAFLSTDQNTKFLPSFYAQENSSEAFAETFLALVTGRSVGDSKESDPSLMGLVARLSGVAMPTKMAVAHAPKGGVTVDGMFYPGGEFIPGKSQAEVDAAIASQASGGSVPAATSPGSWKSSVSPEEFISARNATSRPGFLSPLAPGDIANHKLFLSEDGTHGSAVSPEGDIQNVFNNGGPKGAGVECMLSAIGHGGKTLDCFDGYLPKFYTQFGFTEVGRMKFNRDYAPPGWDYEKYGEPDVVFMSLTKRGDENAIRSRVSGPKEQWEKHSASSQYYSDWDLAKSDSRRAADSPGGGGRQGMAVRRKERAIDPGAGKVHRRVVGMVVAHAPKGGVVINGKPYAGGEFIPGVSQGDVDEAAYNQWKDSVDNPKTIKPAKGQGYSFEDMAGTSREWDNVAPNNDDDAGDRYHASQSITTKMFNDIELEKPLPAGPLDGEIIEGKASVAKRNLAIRLSNALQKNKDFVSLSRMLEVKLKTTGMNPDARGTDQYNVRGAVQALVDSWAESSSDSNLLSMALQSAAISEFDLPREAFDSAMENSNLSRKSTYSESIKAYEPGMRAFLREMYKATQDDLKRRGIKELVLFRGMKFDSRPDWMDGVEDQDSDVEFTSNPLSSWSSDYYVADSFTSGEGEPFAMIAAAVIPASRIISHPGTGLGCLHEREFVVMGGNGVASVSHGESEGSRDDWTPKMISAVEHVFEPEKVEIKPVQDEEGSWYYDLGDYDLRYMDTPSWVDNEYYYDDPGPQYIWKYSDSDNGASYSDTGNDNIFFEDPGTVSFWNFPDESDFYEHEPDPIEVDDTWEDGYGNEISTNELDKLTTANVPAPDYV